MGKTTSQEQTKKSQAKKSTPKKSAAEAAAASLHQQLLVEGDGGSRSRGGGKGDRSWRRLTARALPMIAFLAGITSLFWLFFFDGAWDAWEKMHSPLITEGDPVFYLALIKSLIEKAWVPFSVIQLPRLGAPVGAGLGDYPIPDQLVLAIWALMARWIDNPFLIFNLYFLFSYWLAALAFYGLARRLRWSQSSAKVLGVLYSFLPYHFLRQGHIFLASYFFVPAMTWILLQFWRKNPPGFAYHQPTAAHRLQLSWRLVALLAAFGAMGVYYCFFFCFLALIAGLSAGVYRKRWVQVFSALLCVALTTLSLLVCLAPTFAYRLQSGKNPEALLRNAEGAEIYALKLTNLVVPSRTHRFAFFRALAAAYHPGTLVVEGHNESLGFLSLLGVMALFFELVLLSPGATRTTRKLAILLIFAFCLGTMGGLGSLFASWVTPEFRSLNRISIFIATFGLWVVGIGLEQVRKHWVSRQTWGYLLAAVLLLGLWDQTPQGLKFPDWTVAQQSWDQEFFQQLEARLPPSANVLQLPYVGFPEWPTVVRLKDYEHLRAFLYTQHLRFSYGAMKGRAHARRLQRLSASGELNLFQIRHEGFAAIYIDRLGYADQGKAVEQFLAEALGYPPLLVSRDQRRVCFLL